MNTTDRKMKIGFIKPNYPFEKRVAILPQQVKECPNELIIETGFGETMDIPDAEYWDAGAKITSREDIFATCDIIFSLKLIQPVDYNLLRQGQIIVGWTHPTGSGADFMRVQAQPKGLIVIDLDNIYPSVYYNGETYPIPFIQPNFIRQNSISAGIAAVYHALLCYGILPGKDTKVAILATGNVAQGAYDAMSKFNADIRQFNRKTMPEFYATLGEYDIIINGVEMDQKGQHILTKSHLALLKTGCLIIDAAADADGAIEGTHYTSIGDPMYYKNGVYYYCVNNVPSLIYRTTSEDISAAFAKAFYNQNIASFLQLIRK